MRESDRSLSVSRRLLAYSGVTLFLATVLCIVYYRLLAPVLVSLLITYLVKPVVDRLEAQKIHRAVLSSGVILIITALFAFTIALLAPILFQQAYNLMLLVPDAVNLWLSKVLPVIDSYLIDTGLMTREQLNEALSGFDIVGEARVQLQAGLAGLWATGISVLGGAINVVMIPIITFFMLQEYPRISRYLWSLVPTDFVSGTQVCLERVNATLRSVVKGQALVAGSLAILYVIGLNVIGLKSAVAIGVVAGICRFIPYFDIVVGGLLSAIVIMSEFQGWSQVFGVVLVFLVVQTIDAAFITPRIVGERVGVHPAIVIVSIIAFADWFGFWGVVFAIPVVATVKTLWNTFTPAYRRSRWYNPGGGLQLPRDGI